LEIGDDGFELSAGITLGVRGHDVAAGGLGEVVQDFGSLIAANAFKAPCAAGTMALEAVGCQMGAPGTVLLFSVSCSVSCSGAPLSLLSPPPPHAESSRTAKMAAHFRRLSIPKTVTVP